jgi:hypothetical protein
MTNCEASPGYFKLISQRPTGENEEHEEKTQLESGGQATETETSRIWSRDAEGFKQANVE